ncbi:hypothetical protein, partial [Nocardioides sp.]|uniref:hypothetical protein n=1 Tax=Nocardioides sp. TaxID=35761 RepID=UPI0025E4D961
MAQAGPEVGGPDRAHVEPAALLGLQQRRTHPGYVVVGDPARVVEPGRGRGVDGLVLRDQPLERVGRAPEQVADRVGQA